MHKIKHQKASYVPLPPTVFTNNEFKVKMITVVSSYKRSLRKKPWNFLKQLHKFSSNSPQMAKKISFTTNMKNFAWNSGYKQTHDQQSKHSKKTVQI